MVVTNKTYHDLVMIQIHGLIVVCALKIAQVCVKVGNVAFKTIFVSLNFLGVIW
jgi:hypothetical protein